MTLPAAVPHQLLQLSILGRGRLWLPRSCSCCCRRRCACNLLGAAGSHGTASGTAHGTAAGCQDAFQVDPAQLLLVH